MKKVNQGIYRLTMTDIMPIIQIYGDFDNTTLKLTTTATTKPIEIWLYEIINIPLEEYATISYINNILTVTTQLPSDLYRVQYTTDGGTSWELYNSPVTIAQENGIQIRLLNTEGTVVSNTLKITNGYVEESDTTAPTVTLTTMTNTTISKSHSTTIQIVDEENVTYSYGWTISATTAPTNWISSTSKEQEVIINTGTGDYYLWIKELEDNNGNTAQSSQVGGIDTINLISGVFKVDNTKPEMQKCNASAEPTKIKMEIEATDNDTISRYTYKIGTTSGTGTEQTLNAGKTIENLQEGTKYYIKIRAYDRAGNYEESEEIEIRTIQTMVAWNGTADTSWYNSNSTTFDIYTAEQLAGLASLVNGGNTFEGKTINLMNDIVIHSGIFSGATTTYYYTLNGTQSNVANIIGTILKPWIPIGTDTTYFKGTFNGNYNTISGLFLTGAVGSAQGIFAYSSGTIEKTIVDNACAYGNGSGGIVCAVNSGIIQNCKTSSYRYSTNGNGGNHTGICGQLDAGGTIRNCVATGYAYSLFIGGINGRNSGGTIANCYYKGTLVNTLGSDFTGQIGGISMQHYNNNARMYNCYTSLSATVTSGLWFQGDIYGLCDYSGAIASYVYANSGSGISGIAGRQGGTINNSSFYNASTKALASRLTINNKACTTLVDALNEWVNVNGVSTYSRWVQGTDGYPAFDWE